YSPELIQCTIYDGNTKNAKLVGVEYVVPDSVYQSFSASEKKYWHPHDGEVSSGMLAMPGLPPEKERDILNFVSKTWGKTWHMYRIGQDKFPVGEPHLMWAVDPKQIKPETKKAMEERKNNPTFSRSM